MVMEPAPQDNPKAGALTGENALPASRAAARATAFAAATHLLVDLACFYLLAGRFSVFAGNPAVIAAGFLLYNVLAFGLQLPIGEWADRRRSRTAELHRSAVAPSSVELPRSAVAPISAVFQKSAGRGGTSLASAGMLLVAAGVLLPELRIWLAGGADTLLMASRTDDGILIAVWVGLCVAAIGNACFHIGAGAAILGRSADRMADSGVFIAGGALGVSLGTWMGRAGQWMPGMLLVAVGTVFALSYGAMRIPRSKRPLAHAPAEDRPVCPPAAAIVLLCLLAVMVRAYAGSAMPIVWKSRTELGLFLMPSVCVFAGKFAGGFLADRFGARRTAVASLLAALPLLFIWGGSVVPCAVGLFSVSITTALTLVAIARVLPGHEGLAFGLTTLALLLGSTPTFLFRLPDPAGTWVLAGLTALAAGLLFLVLDNERAGSWVAWYDVGETDGSLPRKEETIS